MGKKVTYGIEYTRASNIPEGFAQHINKYKTLLAEGRFIRAAQTIIEVTEWLLDESDEQDDPEDPGLLKYIERAARYCEKVIKLLQDRDDKDLLPRAHNNIGQCYLKLHVYESAIQHGLMTVNIFKQSEEQARNKSNLQNAYKVLGDIYFTKSLNRNESRYDDFENAHRYYKLEREIIDTMTLDDIEDPEQDDIEKLKQSSHFNMGVMEAKTPSWYGEAEKNLKTAITIAHQLKDHASEKTAWWELGNLYKRVGQFDNVKYCQNKEFRIIRKHGFKEDEIYCFEERLKLHLFLDEYENCFKLYEETLKYIDPSDHTQCRKLNDMTKRIKLARDEITHLINSGDQNSPISTLFLQYVRLLNDYELHRMIIKTVDTGLASLFEARDYSNLVHVQLLQYKTEALWNLRESKKDVHLRSSSETFEFIEAALVENKLDRLKLTIDVFKLRIQIHTYYDQKLQKDSCQKLLIDAVKEEKLLRKKLENQSRMDVGIIGYNRITPRANQSTTTNIRVKVLTTPVPFELHLRYSRMPDTVEKLMKDVSVKCWFDYGVEPKLSHMRTLDKDIFPKGCVQDMVTNDNQYMEAFVKSIVRKQPLQLYKNACSRLKLATSNTVQERLERQDLIKVSLNNLDITSGQIASIQQLLQHSITLKLLDLSSNFLSDDDLSILLTDAYKGLNEMNLSNNLLTTACLSKITIFPKIRMLDLSYNNLGPTILKRLPDLLQSMPSLKELKLVDTNLGGLIEIDGETKEAYISYGMTVGLNSSLTINLSNNHFRQDMLWHWTNLWTNLKRISTLGLSNMTSDTGWDNFDLLSDLPKLSDLIFSFSTKNTLNMCNFRQFFMLKPELNHLDFTCCDLTSEDIGSLSLSIKEYIIKLKKLTLNSNPKIGDEGIYFLNIAIVQSKIDILDVSDCGLTNKSMPELARWTNHLLEINMTDNLLLFNPHLPEENQQFINELNKSIYIKLDDYKGVLSQNAIPEHKGLSFRHVSKLPTTPF